MLHGKKILVVLPAYQAAKTHRDKRKPFTECTPREAKKMGREVELTPNWEQIKLMVMVQVTRRKFFHEELALKLMETGQDLLVEGNTWGDTYWGVCDGKGFNHLGQILMMERMHLRYAWATGTQIAIGLKKWDAAPVQVELFEDEE